MSDSRSALEKLLYAQTWEDSGVLRQALALGPEDTALSIAAAGDNTLALLLDNPKRVIAIDRNPVQLEVLRLKMAALRTLPRESTLELLGERPCVDRDGCRSSA